MARLNEQYLRMQKLAGLITESNQITPEFQELKKQQAAIKDQQNYLIKISSDLKIDRKLIGDYNGALNALLDAIFKANYDKVDEGQLNELSTGGLDPKVLFDFVEKYGTTFAGTDTSELKSVEGKELFLDDLLTTQAGMDMLSNKLPKFVEALKQYNIKLNLTKANLEHPNMVAKVYDALIKPGIIKLDDLKNTPGIVDKMDAQSANWSDEVINGLKDQNHINAAQMLKSTAK